MGKYLLLNNINKKLMKKTLLVLCAGLLGAAHASAQTDAQVMVTSGYTADVVMEGTPVEDYLVGGIDNSSVGLFTKTIKMQNFGISTEMPLVAYESEHKYYIDYTTNNALRLIGPDDDDDTLPSEGILYPAEEIQADSIFLLAICGNGPTTLTVEIGYTDGNYTEAEIEVEDWWNASTDEADHVGLGEAFWGLDRIDIDSDTPQGVVAVRLLEKGIDTDETKTIEYIYIGKAVDDGYPSILGVTTGDTPVIIESGFNADVVAENLPVADYVTVSLDANAWVLYTDDLELTVVTEYGLADDGYLNTISTDRTYYVDYANLNATRLTVDDPETTLVLEGAPVLGDEGAIVYFATAGNGPAEIDVTYNYADGTTSTSEISIIDWCNNTSYASIITGRYYSGVSDSNYVGIYEIEDWEVEVGKAIESITLTNNTTGSSKGIVMGIYMLDGELSSTTTGIDTVSADTATTGKAYNLAGQQVSSSYKGIVIIDGKKFVRK